MPAPLWKPGERPVGRAKGTPNKKPAEAREFCEKLITDAEYRANLRERLLAGKLHPGIESMIWYFAIGKPREDITINGTVTVDVAGLDTAELLIELAEHRRELDAFLLAQPAPLMLNGHEEDQPDR